MGRPRKNNIPKFNTLTKVDFGEGRLVGLHEGSTLGNFNEISDLGSKYLYQVVIAIELANETLAFTTARTHFGAAKKFLRFIRRHESEEAKIIRSHLQCALPAEIDINVASFIEMKYREELCKKYTRGSSTLAANIKSTNAVLRNLASRNLWPHTLRLNIEKKNSSSNSTRYSMLECLGQTNNNSSIKKLPEVEIKRNNTLNGLRKLGVEIPNNNKQLLSALLNGEHTCLKKLHSAAADIFKCEYNSWIHMKGIVDDEMTRSGSEINEWVTVAILNSTNRERNYSFWEMTREIFECSEIGLARFMIAIKILYLSGNQSAQLQIPVELRQDFSISLYTFVQRLLPILEIVRPHAKPDIDSFRSLLSPSTLCLASVMTLLMAETGMNTSPVLALPWCNVKETDAPNWISLASWKDRAGGTLIREELELSKTGEEISAGSALMMLKQMSINHVSNAKISDSEIRVFSSFCGFIGEGFNPTLRSISIFSFRAHFNSIVKNAFGIVKAVIVPSSLRPSLLTTIRGESRSLASAQLAAGHKSRDTTFKSYTGNSRTVFSVEHSDDIRDFQERLATVAVFNMATASESGISTVLTEKLDDAIRTGLGTLCLQKKQHPTEPLQCTKIEDCPNCTSITISTQENDLTDLLFFHQHLKENQPWLETFREEAWKSRWIFWLILVEEVIHRGKRSTWSKNLQKAQTALNSKPNKEFPPLW